MTDNIPVAVDHTINGESHTRSSPKEKEVTNGDEPKQELLSSTRESNTTEDEDLPPLLKYKRISGLPRNFFASDPISTCVFHEKLFIFATHSGMLHLTDTNLNTKRTFKAHNASVLSVYTDGSYFASGSIDGTVVIGSVTDIRDIIKYDFKRPIHAIALDKNYSKSRTFISGGMSGKVIISSKNWIGNKVDLIVEENNGPIVAIYVLDDLVLWMNDVGITAFSLTTRSVIASYERPKDAPRSDLYWPRIYSPELNRIFVAWANYIWSLQISSNSMTDSSDDTNVSSKSSKILSSSGSIFMQQRSKKVELQKLYVLDDLIAGISCFKNDQLMILVYQLPTRDEETQKLIFHNPDIKLLNMSTGTISFEEEIGLKDVEHLGLNDYLLGTSSLRGHLTYYVISAKDGVSAEELLLHDRIDWYASNDLFYEAWKTSEHFLPYLERLNYGISYLDSLIKIDQWEAASKFLPELLSTRYLLSSEEDDQSMISKNDSLLLKNNSSDAVLAEISYQWDNWANIFIKSGHIKYLAPIIPKEKSLQINQKIYNLILHHCIITSDMHEVLYNLMDSWDMNLYDITFIENEAEKYLKEHSDEILRRFLADMYIKSLEPKKAVDHLVALKDPNIVPFLAQNHLLEYFKQDLPEYISLRFKNLELQTLPIDAIIHRIDDIVELLVEHRDEPSVSFVVQVMTDNKLDFVTFSYLEKLSAIDPLLVQPYANERIELYSKYDRSQLLSFLTRNDNYDIETAIKLCENNQFIEELVYLLGKTGENKKAVELIVKEINDPYKAIKFAKHQNDREAWETLLSYAMKHASYIKALIETADEKSQEFYNPISIIQRMPKDIRIEGLKDTVSKISDNYELTLLLNQFILRIVERRSQESACILQKELLKGYEVDTSFESIRRLIKAYDTMILVSNSSLSESEIIGEHNNLKAPTLLQLSFSFSSFDKKMKHLKKIKERLAMEHHS